MHATGITAAGPRQFDGMSATPDADRSELLLVHGAWHGAWAFDELGSRLDEAGLRWRAVNLPSAGSTADLAADADVVRQALAERAVPTVLVGHSYGGLVISEAAAGVDHVTALVYLCAFMLDAGESLLSAQQHQVPHWIAVDEQAGTSTVGRRSRSSTTTAQGSLPARPPPGWSRSRWRHSRRRRPPRHGMSAPARTSSASRTTRSRLPPRRRCQRGPTPSSASTARTRRSYRRPKS
jgi:pimeloyl-ACP methyl ester carboxylesterase